MRASAMCETVSLESHERASRSCFSEAQRQFEALISWAEASEGTLSEVEEGVEQRGRSVLRAVLQGHLDLRAAQEMRLGDVEGADGIKRKHRRHNERRTVGTLLGEVETTRIRYEARGGAGGSLCPLDGQLNVPAQKYSHRVARQVALGASTCSFETALEGVEERSGIAVPKRQAEQLVQRSAVDFAQFYAQRPVEHMRESLTDSTITVLTTDAKGILVYPEDLRADTQKKLLKECGDGLHFRKRMAQVAAVYHVAPFERSVDSIISGLMRSRSKEPKPKRPKPQDKRVWASIVDDPEAVIDETLREALRRDPRQRTSWVAVVDGAEHQINVLRELARARGLRLIIICDIIHVLGYLWEAAKALIADANGQGPWVATRLRRILQGQVSQVAAGIRRAKTMRRRKLSKAQRATLDTCADYLLNHKHYLRYDEYLDAGFPISSGVIEGTVRHLVNDRMAITGAHWRLASAEAVLRFRALRSSGDFNDYWAFHEQCELVRNHLNRYRKGILPGPRPPSHRGHCRPELRLVC